MDWQILIINAYKSRMSVELRTRPAFRGGSSESEIDHLEFVLGHCLPRSLRSLLLQSNGVAEELQLESGDWIESSIVVYSAEQMIDANVFVRQTFPERDPMRYCYFSGAGTDGIQFGLPVAADCPDDAEVFAWYPDQTPDKFLADGLATFLADWCSGQASV
ncbi:SMI1/KNR4 family protein [Stieleria varia]|uniref:Knr4/Smi1-like domain-containing protein n=1 Tax=Stieleria varia TaxID=2528005 RepID=A0A5C5ZXP4_9BACT|nr:SMI1/KNR4 family protein [Stieleria varia]TWT91757.1 hypothetical protein Pla52n_65070 [Stieleria varia]